MPEEIAVASDLEVAAQAKEVAAKDKAAVQQAHAQALPQATEPLAAGAVNALGQVLAKTLSSITGGQYDPSYERVAGPQEQVPADIGTDIMGLASMIDKRGEQAPQLREYAFDPLESMRSVQGLEAMTQVVAQMGSDPELAKQLGAPGGEVADDDDSSGGEPSEPGGGDGGRGGDGDGARSGSPGDAFVPSPDDAGGGPGGDADDGGGPGRPRGRVSRR